MNAEDRRAVRKAFNAAGVDRLPGEVVDVREWRWAEGLEDQAMIVALPLSHEHITCGCGRHWLDVTAMVSHACTDGSVQPATSAGSAEHVDRTEPKQGDQTTEDEQPATESDTSVVSLVDRGGGWWDVRVAGEIINPHAMRRVAAQAMIDNLEIATT